MNIKDTLFIVMPAYNEEENIKTVIKQWYPILTGKSEDSRLVVADSGSTDRTHEILVSMKEEQYPQLEILTTTGTFHGPKVIALYNYAINAGGGMYFRRIQMGRQIQTNLKIFGI